MTTPDLAIQRYSVVSAFMNNQTDEQWDLMVKQVNALGMSDGEPDPDLPYTFHCSECGDVVQTTMSSVADGGSPHCAECDEPMTLGQPDEDEGGQ